MQRKGGIVMEKLKKHEFITQIFWEIIGSICIAAGIYNFAAQARFPMSGFSGISIILYQLWGVPIGLSTILLNVPVSILCFRLLGKSFFISSMRCMVISSILIDYVAPLFPVYTGSRLLAALCTGVIAGLGYAVIYMKGSSTGGMDFIIMAVKKKKPHVPVGRIIFFSDLLVVLMGGMILQDIDGTIYGIIVTFLLSTVVDKLMYGVNAGKMAMIVTDYGQLICDVIDETCQRGTTRINAVGGYRGDQRQLVMCACSNKEMYSVQQAVKKADPCAFIIIVPSDEVHGEGFSHIQVG